MAENRKNKTGNRKKRDDTASVVASIAHCTPANVRMVMNGQVTNPKILWATVEYHKRKSELIKAIEELIQFD